VISPSRLRWLPLPSPVSWMQQHDQDRLLEHWSVFEASPLMSSSCHVQSGSGFKAINKHNWTVFATFSQHTQMALSARMVSIVVRYTFQPHEQVASLGRRTEDRSPFREDPGVGWQTKLDHDCLLRRRGIVDTRGHLTRYTRQRPALVNHPRAGANPKGSFRSSLDI
jgi:hypothetical protein